MNTQELKNILKEKEEDNKKKQQKLNKIGLDKGFEKSFEKLIDFLYGKMSEENILLLEIEANKAKIEAYTNAISAIETREKEILDNLLKNVEEGKVGKIDYLWDGKKVVRDNIIFTREELKQQITNQSPKIDVEGKLMIPPALKVSSKTASVTSDTPQGDKEQTK